jgi:hypothetical protein
LKSGKIKRRKFILIVMKWTFDENRPADKKCLDIEGVLEGKNETNCCKIFKRNNQSQSEKFERLLNLGKAFCHQYD